jgi:hypothetical protein
MIMIIIRHRLWDQAVSPIGDKKLRADYIAGAEALMTSIFEAAQQNPFCEAPR